MIDQPSKDGNMLLVMQNIMYQRGKKKVILYNVHQR